MRAFLIAFSSLLTVSAMIPYLIEVARGKTKPRLVTWFIWALLAGIGGATAFASHQIPAGVFITTTSLESAAVVVLGIRNGDRSFEKLDIFCLIGAVAGLSVWIFLKSPELTTLAVILVDAIGAVPTVKHSWLYPHEETWITYALFVLGEIIILSITNFHVFTGYAYPVFYFLEDGALTMIILLSPYRKLITMPPATGDIITKRDYL